MITEQQQELASLYAVDALTPGEASRFERELLGNSELLEFTRGLQRAAGLVAATTPAVPLPPGLKAKVLKSIEEAESEKKSSPKIAATSLSGLRFVNADDSGGWKQLPVPGAWIKLLSLEKERGYAVLMGRLEPGTRYPAHVNPGPEDFVILAGDLFIGDRRLGPGDFHHADSGSLHEENRSVAGCTLLAVLTTDDPLVAFAIT